MPARVHDEVAETNIEPSEFRRLMGHFPSGVTVVTSSFADGSPCGLTVNSFCSVSLAPPVVLVCIERITESRACILEGGTFAVNILETRYGEGLARRFAEPLATDKFRGVAYRPGSTGAPIFEQALAWLECRVTEAVEGGDHTVFLAEVIGGDAREGHPLVYYRGGYGRFDP